MTKLLAVALLAATTTASAQTYVASDDGERGYAGPPMFVPQSDRTGPRDAGRDRDVWRAVHRSDEAVAH